MLSMHKLSAAVSAAILFGLSAPAPAQEVRVTIVTILANDRNQIVDSKLTEVKREVQKREPSLTGYRLGRTGHRDINVGQKEAIKLFDNDEYSADVKLLARNDTKKRATIEVKPPQVGAITYETCYDKFFPIVTRSVVNGERLIIGIMVKPVDKAAKP
ncbi:MAG TPA: hypothetical protein VGL71_15055 [Urbifossiella sp.]